MSALTAPRIYNPENLLTAASLLNPERGYANPIGVNQYRNCHESVTFQAQFFIWNWIIASKDDERFLKLLRYYHTFTINTTDVQESLEREHGIVVR